MNLLEPDVVGEHLVAKCFADQPPVLGGVLDRGEPQALAQPLDLHARSSADRPQLAVALRSVLTERLGALCAMAIDQAAVETDLDLVLGETTLAAALNRAVTVIRLDREALAHPNEARSTTLGPSAIDTPMVVERQFGGCCRQEQGRAAWGEGKLV